MEEDEEIDEDDIEQQIYQEAKEKRKYDKILQNFKVMTPDEVQELLK